MGRTEPTPPDVEVLKTILEVDVEPLTALTE
jgi:hypothetical protein